MAAIKVGGSVKKVLQPGEEVIGKIAGASPWDSVEYYATGRRMLRFERSGWWFFFFGLLGLLKRKEHTHTLEYSRLLGTEFVSHRPAYQVITGLIIGLITMVPGAAILVAFRGAEGVSYFGWFLILMGGVCVALLCGIKQTYCQFQISDVDRNELKKWRIYLPKIGAQAGKVRQFARLVDGQKAAGRPVAVPLPAPTEEQTVPLPLSSARMVLPDNSEIHISGKTRRLGRADFEKYLSPEALMFISRQHFLIISDGGKYYVEDLNSANGTKANGVLMRSGERHELKDGDRILVADVLTLTFRTGNPS